MDEKVTLKTGPNVHALLLANGINRIKLSPDCIPDIKGVLEFAGKPSIIHVVRALLESESIDRIRIVGPVQRLMPILAAEGLPPDRVDFSAGGSTLVESILLGLQAYNPDDRVLLTTADLPLLTSEAVDDFIAACRSRGNNTYEHAVYLSGVEQRAFRGIWSNAPVKFLRFAGQAVVHGNLALVSPGLHSHSLLQKKLAALHRHRKNPLRMTFTLGIGIALVYLIGAYAMRLVSLKRMVSMISSSLNLGIVPVKINHPGIALDVDEPADYRFVMKVMELQNETDRNLTGGVAVET